MCQRSHSLYQMVRKSKLISSETHSRDLSANWKSRILLQISRKQVTHLSITVPNATLAHHSSAKLLLKLTKPLFWSLLLRIEKPCLWLWGIYRTRGALRYDLTAICITHQVQKQHKYRLLSRNLTVIQVMLGCLIIVSSSQIRRFWWLIIARKLLNQIITWW